MLNVLIAISNMTNIILPRDIEVVVASFGGVGTSFLMSYIAQFKRTNSPKDKDGLKHLPLPPISLNPNVKFIYVYGDPKLATISLFRRGFQTYQSYKLQWGKVSVSPIPRKMTLQEYASAGIDRFNFREQFYNWYDKFLVHETMFIRYETIFENIEPLLEFLEVPRTYIDTFPKRRDRKSSESEISFKTLESLNDIYGSFCDELAMLQDVEVRKRNVPVPWMTTYLSKSYRNALIWTTKDSFKEANPGIYNMLRKIKKFVKYPSGSTSN